MRERSRWVKVTIDEKEPLWKCQYKGEKGASRQSQQRDKVLHPIRCHSPPSITNTENLFTYSISCIHTAGTTPPNPCQPRLPQPSSFSPHAFDSKPDRNFTPGPVHLFMLVTNEITQTGNPTRRVSPPTQMAHIHVPHHTTPHRLHSAVQIG
jgi:hypothetical protein